MVLNTGGARCHAIVTASADRRSGILLIGEASDASMYSRTVNGTVASESSVG